MRTTRMLFCGVAAGAGIGCSLVYLGRWQFIIGVLVVALAIIMWGIARDIRPRRRGLWIPPLTEPTLIFATEPRDCTGLGCGRCGHPGFLEHRCVDGTFVPGHLDLSFDYRDGRHVPFSVQLPTDDQVQEWRRREAAWRGRDPLRDFAGTWPFANGAPE